MFSGITRTKLPTAAWRISAWTLLAFAILLTSAFTVLHTFVAEEIRGRSDAWLRGEAKVLGQVAERAAKGNLYDEVVAEVAELATKEVPDIEGDHSTPNESVIFLDSSASGKLKLWVGKGNGPAALTAISTAGLSADQPRTIRLPGSRVPFRVVRYNLSDGSLMYLGLSEAGFQAVMSDLRVRFILLWIALLASSFAVLFLTIKHMLNRIQRISDTASQMGSDDLTTRLPQSSEDDEISRLASTLNHMLDRIQTSVRQLHLITESLAHDLKSPITAVRGQLEQALCESRSGGWIEPVGKSIEELDRLSDFLTASLDVAEANAGALRLDRSVIDLSKLLESMIELYEPSIGERGLRVQALIRPGILVHMDAALTHRMLANLFDNEVRHPPSGSTISIDLGEHEDNVYLTIADDGCGFPPEVSGNLFQRSCRGSSSKGRGMGLAFIKAIVCAHGGHIIAENPPGGGARLVIRIARCPQSLRAKPELERIEALAT